MNLEIEIVATIAKDDANYNRVEFTIDNGDSVGLIDSVSVALACYLHEHDELQPGPFAQLIEYINTTAFDAIQVGKKFCDE